MSIRLNKAIKEFGVGLQSITDLLKQKGAPVRIIEPDLSQFDLNDETKTYNYSWEVVFDGSIAEPKLYMGDPEFDSFSAILIAYETPSSVGGAPNKFLFKAGLRETLFENIEESRQRSYCSLLTLTTHLMDLVFDHLIISL